MPSPMILCAIIHKSWPPLLAGSNSSRMLGTTASFNGGMMVMMLTMVVMMSLVAMAVLGWL